MGERLRDRQEAAGSIPASGILMLGVAQSARASACEAEDTGANPVAQP